jgi:antagonist of KipI
MLTTVQDLGRWGHQDRGVPVAGPMDSYSHRLANRLVENDEAAAALEVTLTGPEIEAEGPVVCAVAGARFEVYVNGSPVDAGGPFEVPAGGRLRLGARSAGARATLAVRGGFDVPETLGSRATSIVGRMGPFGGRPLAPGDVLPVGSATPSPARWAGRAAVMPDGGARVRVILGPHDSMFTSDAIATLLGSRFIVTPQSNRMGFRMRGPVLQHAGDGQILSDATPLGSIQVPPSGEPILLMADRQTTGGYPKIATVISADVSMAGQLAPGDWIEFAACARAAAVEALEEQEAALAGAER